jgi:murein L,D-transpeptidase YafK
VHFSTHFSFYKQSLACLVMLFFMALTSYSSSALAKKKPKHHTAQPSASVELVKKRKKKRRAKAQAQAQEAEANETIQTVNQPRAKAGKTRVFSVSDLELAGIYKAISLGQSYSALGQTEALLAKAPNYSLLHLLRADLLLILSQKNMIRTSAGQSYALPALNTSHQQRIRELQQEAWLRLNSQANHAKASREQMVPKQLLKLADNEPFALIVDSKLSRLYVYQNTPNAAPKLVSDYYVTQGLHGSFKLKEGDNRTPIGAYFISGPVSQKLPDLYGYGALNIDYPNAWDKYKGRTGHGIWVHGTPSDTYARAPYASNGCVVLANPDVEMIFKLTNNGSMPIVVVEKLDWIELAELEKTKKTILQAMETWRDSLEKGDLKIIGKAYSDRALSTDTDKKNITTNARKIVLSNIAVIEYPGETDMVIVRFDQNGTQSTAIRKQQYWKKESGNWKIVLENTL